MKVESVRIGGSRNLCTGKKSEGVLVTMPSVLSPHDLFVDVTIDLLKRGQRVRFEATGKSMKPTINEGEIITVEPVNPSLVKRGDIVLYQNHKGVLAHRVVAIQKKSDEVPGLRTEKERKFLTQSSALSPQHSVLTTFFILRGDASGACDEPVKPPQILGRVISVERNGRSLCLNTLKARISHIARRHASFLKQRIVLISSRHSLFLTPFACLRQGKHAKGTRNVSPF